MAVVGICSGSEELHILWWLSLVVGGDRNAAPQIETINGRSRLAEYCYKRFLWPRGPFGEAAALPSGFRGGTEICATKVVWGQCDPVNFLWWNLVELWGGTEICATRNCLISLLMGR